MRAGGAASARRCSGRETVHMAEAPEVLMSLDALGAQLQQALQDHPAPVARDIALLIRGGDDPAAAAFRLQRYQRKVDVARQVMSAYDAGIQRATDPTPLPRHGCLGLGWLFWRQARQGARADRLRWLNSAFNCLDQAGPDGGDAAGAQLQQALDTLLAATLDTA